MLALAIALPSVAGAAELTRIASSFEEKDPFGMFLDLGYERTQLREKITREHHQDQNVLDVSELRYQGVDSRLNLDLRVGLWEDLEFHYGLPIVFQQDRQWQFAAGTTEGNSTITNNCLQADGQLLDPGCPATLAGTRPLFSVGDSSNSYRGGLGDMTFGLAYAFFNQRKDPSKPMWLVGVDYTAPTSEGLDPTLPTAADARGKIGDRIHRYKFYTSLSKRLGPADPYFQIHYTLPYRGPGWYSNCDHPDPRVLGRPENCNTDEWPRLDTGIRPPHVGGVVVGTELNAFEDQALFQKLAFDLRGLASYVSEGRYYNELSDPFTKLLYTQDYLQLGGSVGLVAHAAEYLHLKASAALLYNTEHTLTDESIGKDLDGDGNVNVTASPREINPNFDWRADMVSRRFRASEAAVFRLEVSAALSF